MLGYKTEANASEPCCSTYCAMGTIGISDKCQLNHKNIWSNRDSNPDLMLEKFLSSPQCRDHLFGNKNIWQKYNVIKRRTTILNELPKCSQKNRSLLSESALIHCKE